MSPVEFEPTISAGERPQTYALDRAATGTGEFQVYLSEIKKFSFLTAVSVKTVVLWDVIPYSFVRNYQLFEEIVCLQIQHTNRGLIFLQTDRRNVP